MREGRANRDELRICGRSLKGLGARVEDDMRVAGRPFGRSSKERTERDENRFSPDVTPYFGATRAFLGRSERSNGRAGMWEVGRSVRCDEVRFGADAPTPCVPGRVLVCRSGRLAGLLSCREDFIPAILTHNREKNKSPGDERSVKVAKVSEVGYISVSSRSHQCEHLRIYGNPQYRNHRAR